MTRKGFDDLSDMQKEVLDILWNLEEATVHDVIAKLNRKKAPAYTTVLTVLQRLEKIGWLKHRIEGKSNVYHPTRAREQEASRSIKRLVNQIFHGDSSLLFQHLIEEELSSNQLDNLRKMIDKKRKGDEK